MLIDKSKLFDSWYEDENGKKYTAQDNLDYKNHKYTYHTAIPNVLNEVIYEVSDKGLELKQGKNKTWNERLVLAIYSTGDLKLLEAIKVSTSCCERCLNVLYAKYLGRKIFYKDYTLNNWKNRCEYCQRLDDEYFK